MNKEEIKIIAPYIEISENDKDISVVSDNNLRFEGINLGEEIIIIDNNEVYQIIVSQNQQMIANGYQIKGEIVAKSHNYKVAKEKYVSYFHGKDIPHIKKDLESAYIELSIVPDSKRFDKNYRLTQGIQGSYVAKFEFNDIGNRWDNVMNEGEYGDKVIGHESLKDEIVSAIAAGKHILLYGPPGTGKTMIASRISEVFECNSRVFTANAEWTADDTVGGYTFSMNQQTERERIEPSNGYVTDVVLECNKNASKKFYEKDYKYRGSWIVIDELNRAKMDFAFGALFTALDKDYSVLNLPQYNMYKNEKSKIFIPNTFRLVGTINNFDKNFLFKFSYALSRRFAHIYVGVPIESEFENEINSILRKIKNELIKEYSVLESEISDMKVEDGVVKVKELASYLRGYGTKSKLRDIGTALLIDTLRLYFIQKYVTKLSNDVNNMIDIAISSIIIPSLEGVIEDTTEIKIIMRDCPRVIKALNEFESINY
ncbi:MoxR-like ATPase [Clostridium acidisoli DSM 12555]|uniref:MoxR-like ATPase n=1 Tax=Clostridium acidisoli DSM 12555 TaxID=1121291 RepID=A0A1W1X4C3_9CLOT|nr:AAA family ATPase [Clostridium acidisoli]SMC18804.1 MoxR-like ATPase [Clostridium acidisoli DSM 12555]